MCEACNDSTINFTQFKDEQLLGSIEEVDQLMESFRSVHNVPGCALGVVQDDEIVYLKGYGLADVATNRPFTVGTPSGVGSVAKTITASLLLRAEGERARRMLRHDEEEDFERAATLAIEMFEARRRPRVTAPDDMV